MDVDPEALQAKLRAIEDARLAEGHALWFHCEHCHRDFLSNRRERFRSRRCRVGQGEPLRGEDGHLPEEPPEDDLDGGLEDDTRVYDPRRGIYRTKSWTKWA